MKPCIRDWDYGVVSTIILANGLYNHFYKCLDIMHLMTCSVNLLCPALSYKTYCYEIKVNPFMDIDPNQMEFFLWAACFALYKIPSDLRLRHFDDSTLTKWCDLVTHMQGHTSIRVQLNTPAMHDIRGKILEKQTNRHSVSSFQKREGCKIFHLVQKCKTPFVTHRLFFMGQSAFFKKYKRQHLLQSIL